MRPMLLALHPRWAELILRGAKTAEVRRRIPAAGAAGRVAALYATAPVSALVGQARFSATLSGAPEAVWREMMEQGEEPCLARREYDAYARGAPTVHALLIDQCIAHRALRLSGPAPRDWRWLTPREQASIGDWVQGSML